MQRLDEIRRKIDLVSRDCQSASKSLAVIDPFVTDKAFEHIQSESPGIVSVITDKLCRYAVICMGRVWDKKGGVASIKNVVLLATKEWPAATEVVHTYDALENSDIVKRLRGYRNNFGAHTSSMEPDPLSLFTPIELKKLHIQTDLRPLGPAPVR